jgi:hypothetical protein
MAATAADVRSILSLPEPSSTPGPSQPKKPAATSTRKPEGISRELYSLIGPSAPSIAAQLAKPRLKQKPNFGSSAKVRWYLSNNFAIFCSIILDFKGVAYFPESCTTGFAEASTLGEFVHRS